VTRPQPRVVPQWPQWPQWPRRPQWPQRLHGFLGRFHGACQARVAHPRDAFLVCHR
jgi:hypothetical protein